MASEFHKGKAPLFAATIGVACGASPVPFNVFPLVIGPLHNEFGWSFAALSAGVTVYGILGALLAPAIGRLVDRYGVRPVALTSLGLFGIAFSLFAFLPNNIGAYFLLWALVGVVGIGSTPVSWSRAISMWFFANRGLALGIMLLGTSLSAMVIPPIGNAVLQISDWRMVFPAIALMPLLVALPLALVLFREPGPEEMTAQLTDEKGDLAGMPFAEALRDRRFWILFGSVVVIALAYGGAHIHMVQIVTLKGYSATFAASVMSVVALGIFAGRIIVGMLFDRIWAPAAAFPVLVMPILACILLIGDGTGSAAIYLAALLLGFAAGAESDIIAFMAARYFGMRAYGRIYGALYMPFGIFASVSPLLYGYVRDTTGSYDIILMAAACLFATGATALLFMGRYPDYALKDGPKATQQGLTA